MKQPMTEKQIDCLRAYVETGDHPMPDDYFAGGTLWFRNRERVIDALKRRGYLDEHCVPTLAGREALAAIDGGAA